MTLIARMNVFLNLLELRIMQITERWFSTENAKAEPHIERLLAKYTTERDEGPAAEIVNRLGGDDEEFAQDGMMLVKMYAFCM